MTHPIDFGQMTRAMCVWSICCSLRYDSKMQTVLPTNTDVIPKWETEKRESEKMLIGRFLHRSSHPNATAQKSEHACLSPLGGYRVYVDIINDIPPKQSVQKLSIMSCVARSTHLFPVWSSNTLMPVVRERPSALISFTVSSANFSTWYETPYTTLKADDFPHCISKPDATPFNPALILIG